VCEVSAILRTHIEQLERSYMEALERALTRLEEREKKRAEMIRKALENLDIEQERQKIRQIMAEIQAKNSASRRVRRP
jgi:coenzyme F420-reducing hydrogenase delta subunit